MRASIQSFSALIVATVMASPARAQQTPAEAAPASEPQITDLTDTTLSSPPAPTPAAPAATTQGPTPVTATPAQAAPSVPPPATAPTTMPPAAAASGAVSPTPPDIGRERIHQGYYMRMISGPSFVSMTGNGPNGKVSLHGLGSGLMVAFGGSIGRGLVLAGTIQASDLTAKFNGGPFVGATVTAQDKSFAATSKATVGTSELGVLIDWYPNPGGGWHTGLSLGLGLTSLQNLADESTLVGVGGAGGLFGGYDWSIAPTWALGLDLLVTGSTPANMKDAKDSTDTGYRLRSFSVGLGASILYF